jgi:hypothetical protein
MRLSALLDLEITTIIHSLKHPSNQQHQLNSLFHPLLFQPLLFQPSK